VSLPNVATLQELRLDGRVFWRDCATRAKNQAETRGATLGKAASAFSQSVRRAGNWAPIFRFHLHVLVEPLGQTKLVPSHLHNHHKTARSRFVAPTCPPSRSLGLGTVQVREKKTHSFPQIRSNDTPNMSQSYASIKVSSFNLT